MENIISTVGETIIFLENVQYYRGIPSALWRVFSTLGHCGCNTKSACGFLLQF